MLHFTYVMAWVHAEMYATLIMAAFPTEQHQFPLIPSRSTEMTARSPDYAHWRCGFPGMTCGGAHLGRLAVFCLILRSFSGLPRAGERRLLPGVDLLRLLSDELLRLRFLPVCKSTGLRGLWPGEAGDSGRSWRWSGAWAVGCRTT